MCKKEIPNSTLPEWQNYGIKYLKLFQLGTNGIVWAYLQPKQVNTFHIKSSRCKRTENISYGNNECKDSALNATPISLKTQRI